MVRKNPNKTFYHYCVETFDDDEFIERKYYMTAKQIIDEYKCSQKAFYNHMNQYNKRSKKLGKIKIYRILERVHVLTPNPELY